MICEVRGVGDGKFEENAKLIVDALNRREGSALQEPVSGEEVEEFTDHVANLNYHMNECKICGYIGGGKMVYCEPTGQNLLELAKAFNDGRKSEGRREGQHARMAEGENGEWFKNRGPLPADKERGGE
jgi:hypothetical protein